MKKTNLRKFSLLVLAFAVIVGGNVILSSEALAGPCDHPPEYFDCPATRDDRLCAMQGTTKELQTIIDPAIAKHKAELSSGECPEARPPVSAAVCRASAKAMLDHSQKERNYNFNGLVTLLQCKYDANGDRL